MTATIAIVIILSLALFVWALSRNSRNEKVLDDVLQPKVTADHLAEPVISYSLYVLDARSSKRIEMQAPKAFSNQFGILNGQSVELHWNVLNADWISIDGVGFVQAIGKKEFYPSENTRYRISAKNRNYTSEQEFYVRVFPVPVMEKLSVPMPDLLSNNIHLFKVPPPSIQKIEAPIFPSLSIPSVIQIGKQNMVEKPAVILLDQENISRILRNDKKEYSAFKTKLFDKMESAFKNNYKVRDIIQTIRKHYE